MELLESKKDILENLAKVLLEKETIERTDLLEVLGDRIVEGTDHLRRICRRYRIYGGRHRKIRMEAARNAQTLNRPVPTFTV